MKFYVQREPIKKLYVCTSEVKRFSMGIFIYRWMLRGEWKRIEYEMIMR